MSELLQASILRDKNGVSVQLMDETARAELLNKVDTKQGVENAKSLLYVGDDGSVINAELGEGFSTENAPGKNLFHGQWEPGRWHFTTGIFEQDATFMGNFTVNEMFPVEPSTPYTFSNTQANTSGAQLYVNEYTADKEFVRHHSAIMPLQQVGSVTITTSASTRYLTVYCYAYDEGNTTIEAAAPIGFMLEKGTSATEYEPYAISKTIIAVGDDIPMPATDDGLVVKDVPGKNLFHGEWVVGKWDTTSTGAWINDSYTGNIGVKEKFPVIPGEHYTFSHAKLFSFFATMYMNEYDEDGLLLKTTNYVIIFNNAASATVQMSERTHYISLFLYQENGSDWQSAIPENFMIERGTAATVYEPYSVVEKLAIDPIPAYDKLADAGLLPERFTVPAYYHSNNYLDAKCARIRELVENCAGEGDAFFFVTDQHWELNARHSPALMRYIAGHVHVPRTFCGGDTVSNSGTALEAYVQTLDNAFSGDIHHVMGNHEYFEDRDGNKLAYLFDMGKANQVGNTKRHYYYVDNPQQKLRYIVLCAFSTDSGTLGTAYDSEQITWLRDTALNVESGWTVIVFTHSLYNEYLTPSPDGADTVAAVLDAATCSVACVITGHMHRDYVTQTPGGIPVVVTTCDKYYPWISDGEDMEPWITASRTEGTLTEQAFDVVVLNKADKQLTFVRIGAPAENWAGGTSDGTTSEERVVTYA